MPVITSSINAVAPLTFILSKSVLSTTPRRKIPNPSRKLKTARRAIEGGFLYIESQLFHNGKTGYGGKGTQIHPRLALASARRTHCCGLLRWGGFRRTAPGLAGIAAGAWDCAFGCPFSSSDSRS